MCFSPSDHTLWEKIRPERALPAGLCKGLGKPPCSCMTSRTAVLANALVLAR